MQSWHALIRENSTSRGANGDKNNLTLFFNERCNIIIFYDYFIVIGLC